MAAFISEMFYFILFYCHLRQDILYIDSLGTSEFFGTNTTVNKNITV